MDILERIVLNKRLEVEQWKIERPMETLTDHLSDGPRYSFREAIANPSGVQIIAEMKKASPSKGLLAENFDPVNIAAAYRQGGAAAISVLTEQKYFKGSPRHLNLAKRTAQLPVLCKDFVIDPYQIYFARAMNADAVLLIAALLSAAQIDEFLGMARELELDCLVEVHTEGELEQVLTTQAEIIGVNSRQLSTFDVSLDRAVNMAGLIPSDKTKVAESGISSTQHIRLLNEAGYQAFLVGEALMRSDNPIALLEELRTA